MHSRIFSSSGNSGIKVIEDNCLPLRDLIPRARIQFRKGSVVSTRRESSHLKWYKKLCCWNWHCSSSCSGTESAAIVLEYSHLQNKFCSRPYSPVSYKAKHRKSVETELPVRNSPPVSGASTVTKAHTKEKPSAKLPKVPVETEKRNCTLGRSFEGISLSLALFLPTPPCSEFSIRWKIRKTRIHRMRRKDLHNAGRGERVKLSKRRRDFHEETADLEV